MKIDKQRYFCNSCKKTFILNSVLYDSGKTISKNTRLSILKDLSKKISLKDIAKDNNVSSTTIDRVLDEASNKYIIPGTLPQIMNIDEFKATKDTDSKMAFIITNNSKGTIFDILNSRKSNDLEKYFKRFPKKQRDNVKFIIMDLYRPYLILFSKLFPNAIIIPDRFHIVVQIYTSLNKSRIQLMKHDIKNKRKLFKYWKLILKKELELDDKTKSYSKCFGKDITEYDIVKYLINLDTTFKNTYEIYQSILKSLTNKDFDTFSLIINNKQKDIHPDMKKALSTFKKIEDKIKNAFSYDYNNGIIEGTNNLIKCIKRISFGYRKFTHFKARILIIKGNIKFA